MNAYEEKNEWCVKKKNEEEVIGSWKLKKEVTRS